MTTGRLPTPTSDLERRLRAYTPTECDEVTWSAIAPSAIPLAARAGAPKEQRARMDLLALAKAAGHLVGFGIMKNPSRQRLRRGQNRLPGLAMATIITEVKVALFNEEQLRIWHDRTGFGPAEHPLLQPDQPDYGFRNLTKGEADDIDAQHLAQLRNGEREESRYAAA